MNIDLTQNLEPGIPDWEGCCGFQLAEQIVKGICVQSLATPSGIGTHMDAPCHFIQGGADIASIPLDQLIVPAVVIDVRQRAHPDYFLGVGELHEFERQHGDIPPHAVILLLTGWSRYWKDPQQYRNVDSTGRRHFPGFSAEAARYLLTKESVGIGLDTLSPDGSHESFPVHEAVLGAGKYILENLCNLEQLPPLGATLVALPLKIKNGAEAPARVVAFMPMAL